jgi:6-phosphogluconolactonase (cycloisomerase 2 family)
MKFNDPFRRLLNGSHILLAGALCCAWLFTGCGGSGDSATSATGGTGPTLTRTEYAYVVNEDDSTVSQFKINTDGTLAALTPVTVPVTPNAVQALITPNSRFAYVMAQDPATGAAVVSQFKINSDGTLTALTPATVSLGTLLTSTSSLLSVSSPLQLPVHVTMDPQGRFLFAPTPSQILAFPISGTGTLGASVAVATLSTPIQAFAMDPKGRFAYVGCQLPDGSVSIAPFTINADGTFTRIAGQDLAIAGVSALKEMTLDSVGRFLYADGIAPVDSQGGNNPSLTQFKVQTDGTLTLVKTTIADLAGINVGTLASSQVIQAFAEIVFQPTFNATGQVAYLPTGTPRVLEDSVGADGSLTPIGPGSVLAGSVSGSVNIEPSGLFAYVPNQDTSVSQFRINTDGTLSPLATPAITAGHRPVSIATTVVTTAVSRAAANGVLAGYRRSQTAR